ncbi:arginine N-succinyltransferase, partial [bacterium]|nr:arginine N-succinyltransferase [bacterium]
RFLYLARNKGRFKPDILAELLPPLNKKGQSPLWEAIGRRFTNMDYWEADRLCQQDKEFIFSLFPTGKIYTTFLSAEARNAVGKVGKDTEPVLHMLKKIGFHYKGQVDPFDGGPHLWAKRDDLVPVQRTRSLRYLGPVQAEAGVDGESGLLCASVQEPGAFRAAHVSVVMEEEGAKVLLSDRDDLRQFERQLGLQPGDEAVFMPYY